MTRMLKLSGVLAQATDAEIADVLAQCLDMREFAANVLRVGVSDAERAEWLHGVAMLDERIGILKHEQGRRLGHRAN